MTVFITLIKTCSRELNPQQFILSLQIMIDRVIRCGRICNSRLPPPKDGAPDQAEIAEVKHPLKKALKTSQSTDSDPELILTSQQTSVS
ncbi:hypothetical protein GDO78_022052 [Eleutherodactylus coqui]|uniref:Uncharacterized protein n=1 Tax=Eleutherodactylus coqui TaxID=57060 RepID=A0A8J6EGA9_ELECQ|nr:hypothetical protein GDO78_022052 [Eleutherodactylus coqui]